MKFFTMLAAMLHDLVSVDSTERSLTIKSDPLGATVVLRSGGNDSSIDVETRRGGIRLDDMRDRRDAVRGPSGSVLGYFCGWTCGDSRLYSHKAFIGKLMVRAWGPAKIREMAERERAKDAEIAEYLRQREEHLRAKAAAVESSN